MISEFLDVSRPPKPNIFIFGATRILKQIEKNPGTIFNNIVLRAMPSAAGPKLFFIFLNRNYISESQFQRSGLPNHRFAWQLLQKSIFRSSRL